MRGNLTDKKLIIIAAVVLTVAAVLVVLAMKKKRNITDFMKKTFTGHYFSVSELCASKTATARGIDNTPNESVRANLEALIENCLDPIREEYGKPIIVSSGYLCPALNSAVGGVSNSQHMTGKAADLVPASGGSLSDIFRAAVKIGMFDQLIYEQNSKGSKWVHVSYDSKTRRGQILSYKSGKYTDITNNWKSIIV